MANKCFIYIVLVAMVFFVISCGFIDGDTEIYLVRDSEDTFHFQWNEPLVTDLIILVRATYHSTDGRSEFEDDLVLLTAGTIQSPVIVAFSTGNYDAFSYPNGDSGTVTITILPAEALGNYPLPDWTYSNGFDGTMHILTGYPFQPYDVGEPSELVFRYNKPKGEWW